MKKKLKRRWSSSILAVALGGRCSFLRSIHLYGNSCFTRLCSHFNNSWYRWMSDCKVDAAYQPHNWNISCSPNHFQIWEATQDLKLANMASNTCQKLNSGDEGDSSDYTGGETGVSIQVYTSQEGTSSTKRHCKRQTRSLTVSIKVWRQFLSTNKPLMMSY